MGFLSAISICWPKYENGTQGTQPHEVRCFFGGASTTNGEYSMTNEQQNPQRGQQQQQGNPQQGGQNKPGQQQQGGHKPDQQGGQKPGQGGQQGGFDRDR